MGIKLASHTAYDITYHFTFIPKYRRRKLRGRLKDRLERMIRFCAQVNSFEIVELNIQPDHVHLLINCKPTDSPAEVMQLIKGGTSKKIREQFPDDPAVIWSNHFWSEGYFVGTVGKHDMRSVIKYVRDQ